MDEAISFMEDYPNYKFFRGSAEGERAPGKDELAYYAVAFDAIPNRDSFSVAVFFNADSHNL